MKTCEGIPRDTGLTFSCKCGARAAAFATVHSGENLRFMPMNFEDTGRESSLAP